jgi:DNA repair protein RadC
MQKIPFDAVPRYEVRLVREGKPIHCLTDSKAALNVARELCADHLDREEMWLLLLDSKQRVVGVHQVSVGTLDQALVHPREVFKAAILANSASIVLAHNHPSGYPKPSDEDRHLVDRLKQASDLLGIHLIDFLVIGREGYHSFRDRGILR